MTFISNVQMRCVEWRAALLEVTSIGWFELFVMSLDSLDIEPSFASHDMNNVDC